MEEKIKDKDYYDAIPILFCQECHSLRIRSYDEETDYCDDCGSTDIAEANIVDWKVKEDERIENKKHKIKY